MPTQEQIKKEVVDNLYWDTTVDAADIRVEVNDGEVTLKGSVPSYTAKTSATSSAISISGVEKVNNQLTVEYPASITVPADSELKNNIEKQLLWDSDIDSTEIEVNVRGGVVTLKGTVDAYWKLFRIENDANIAGIVDINNKVSAVPTEDVLDKDISRDVVSALSRNMNVDADKVNVEVENGIVTLNGTVSSWTEYNSAETAASRTLGVRDINNQLIVNY